MNVITNYGMINYQRGFRANASTISKVSKETIGKEKMALEQQLTDLYEKLGTLYVNAKKYGKSVKDICDEKRYEFAISGIKSELAKKHGIVSKITLEKEKTMLEQELAFENEKLRTVLEAEKKYGRTTLDIRDERRYEFAISSIKNKIAKVEEQIAASSM